MNRRKFLGNTALFSVPLMIKGIPVFAGDAAMHPFLQELTAPTANCGKILVIIQMNGGNDGLNMVIPLDRYSELSNARSSIMLPSASVLPLSGTTTTGLHPAMTGLRNLFNDGKVNLVQGVTYPNPNFSHFQAQDIWFTGSSTLPTLDTGWLGRQLDATYPGFPDGYPNAANPDPVAIQIGGAMPLSLQGPNINMAYNAPNPAALVNVATATPAPAPANDYGTELTFLRMMKDQSNAYANRISAAYNAQATQSSLYPASGNALANQLKIVARLIGGGLGTTVYIVNHPDSFDTHVNQVVPGNTTTGAHANSLGRLSDAIAAFQNDITLMNKADKVTGMTFSEFGRRVISNASAGTDHGSGAPVIFFGAGVNGGVLGTSPVLPATPNSNTQVPMQFDFRQLYASVMQQWLCMTSTESATVLNGVYNTVPIFTTGVLAQTGIELLAGWDNEYVKLTFDVFENDRYDQFVVERSLNGNYFESIHTIANSSGSQQQQYVYRDLGINAPEIFYRIKGVTKQGEAVYSDIVKLKSRRQQHVQVYPNPVINHTINIAFLSSVNENVSITIYGSKGEKLFYNQVNPRGNKRITVKVPATCSIQTMYVLNIVYDGVQVNEKIMFE
ncbi:MAG: DUF1501 domain-containing protein [Sphingobacteriales bacterium]|nr:MAG: DUF1501 domain-containing protein [Sphingobacteriales bacterium]